MYPIGTETVERIAGFATVGVGFSSHHRIADLVDYAVIAEAEGYDSFWIGERYYARGMYTVATMVAQATKRLALGLGIVSPFTRHPALIAMETAALDEVAPGRVILGLGVAQISAERQGLADTKPAISLKEAVAILRSMLAGEATQADGRFFTLRSPGAQLVGATPRPSLPIYLGAMGPKSLQLAGRVADGVVLGMFATPGFVRYARGEIEKGLVAAGRTWADFQLVSYVTFAVDKDSARAKNAVRPQMIGYLSERSSRTAARPGSPRLAHSGLDMDAFTGVKAEVTRYVDAGSLDLAAQAIPDALVDTLVVAGDPDECRERLAAYALAGVDHLVLYQVIGPDTRTGLRLAASEIAAHLRR
ncbi:MAG: LLM class flavin-dependent oxidoreductase [Alphaproteobacteria bacterium]|nr:LLM class flavin-dependent oxidoreductase [Alphaproteobacteria bacterium]